MAHKVKINWRQFKAATTRHVTFAGMLDENERQFLIYWSANRERQGSIIYQLMSGLPVGLLFALPVVLLLFTGRYWYKRADMAAHSQLSVLWLGVGIVAIAVFVAVFYKRHQWEMREEQYLRLKAKEREKV